MHKATGEAGPVLSTPSFLVTGAATMHYPAVIDRVGLCRPGSWARLRWGPGALALFHTTCREQGKLCWDCHFSTGQKFHFCARSVKVVFPKRQILVLLFQKQEAEERGTDPAYMNNNTIMKWLSG